MRFSRSTFLRNTQPRSRGAFFSRGRKQPRLFNHLVRAHGPRARAHAIAGKETSAASRLARSRCCARGNAHEAAERRGEFSPSHAALRNVMATLNSAQHTRPMSDCLARHVADLFQSVHCYSRECNAAHKALPVPPLNSAAAHNDVSLASGGGHGTQSNEVRTRLLDGPCGGGDHPGDQTVGGRARLAEQVGGANSGAGHHLPAAILESVLRARQAVRGTNNAFLTPHQACRDGCPRHRPLCARHASAETVYDTARG